MKYGFGIDLGGTTVKNAGVLDQHGLEVVDQLLGVFQGCAGVHGLAAHLELVFHLRDAVAADGLVEIDQRIRRRYLEADLLRLRLADLNRVDGLRAGGVFVCQHDADALLSAAAVQRHGD